MCIRRISVRLFMRRRKVPVYDRIVLASFRDSSPISHVENSPFMCELMVSIALLGAELRAVVRHAIPTLLECPVWSYANTESILRDTCKPMMNVVLGGGVKSESCVILGTAQDHNKWARVCEQSRTSSRDERRSDACAVQSRRDSERSQPHPLRFCLCRPDHHWCEQNVPYDFMISTGHKRKGRTAGVAKSLDQLRFTVVTKLGVGKGLHRHGSYVLMIVRGFGANVQHVFSNI